VLEQAAALPLAPQGDARRVLALVSRRSHPTVPEHAQVAASSASLSKQAAAEKRLRERQAAGTKIPLYETQQQKVQRPPPLRPPAARLSRPLTLSRLRRI
jgi:hypothetical protein